MTTPDPPRADDPATSPEGLRDAVVQQEHVVTTHLAVIEGWLGLMEDGALQEGQGCRGARVVRERAEALRLDLGALLRLVKEWAGHTSDPSN